MSKLRKGLNILGIIALVSLVIYLIMSIQYSLIDISRKIDINYHLTTIRQYQSEKTSNTMSRMIEANLYIYNSTTGHTGSGTHITLKGEHYILSCAHLIDNPSDVIRARDDTLRESELVLVKYNQKFDLALYRIVNPAVANNRYVELGIQEPEIGNSIIIVGNPHGELNIVTEGIVARKETKGYLLTNLAFFGNSGGGMYYKGELVGVVTQLRSLQELPKFIYTNYSYGIGLRAVNIFLEEYLK